MKESQKLLKERSYVKTWILDVVLTVLTLLGSFVLLELGSCSEYSDVQSHLARIGMKYGILNILTLGCVWAVLLILTNRVWLADMILGALSGIIGIANCFVIRYHGMPLSFQVLRNFTTAMNVIGSYDLTIDRSVAKILAGMVVLTVLCLLVRWLTGKGTLDWKKTLIRDAALVAAAVCVMYFGYFGANPVKPGGTITWLWSEAYYQYGYTACAVESFCQLFDVVKQPEGYSDQAVEAVNIRQETTPEQTPDIILILNETFYDPRQIMDLETDVPYLEHIENEIPNLLTGYAVVPGACGSTNSAEYELLTSNSLELMPGITPFNTLDLRGANSIVSHLNALGYSSLGTHSEPAVNYSRGMGYQALGFAKTYFIDEYQDRTFYCDRPYATDESLYNNLLRWYGEEPVQSPRFLYQLTIQNHGSWDKSDDSNDTVHTLNDYGEYNTLINEFLTSISLSDRAFLELTQALSQVDRQVIVCMVGDHAPNFAASNADERYSEEEQALRIRKVPLLIWANFALEQQDLGTMSMNYVVPTVLELAGVRLSPYYSYLLQLKKSVPILSSYGVYYDAEGNLYHYDQDAGQIWETDVDNYFFLEYNNLTNDRDQSLFDPWQ